LAELGIDPARKREAIAGLTAGLGAAVGNAELASLPSLVMYTAGLGLLATDVWLLINRVDCNFTDIQFANIHLFGSQMEKITTETQQSYSRDDLMGLGKWCRAA
jgi:hypothetical protein